MARYSLEPLVRLSGDLPPSVEKGILRWARLHQAKLLIGWQICGEKIRLRRSRACVDPPIIATELEDVAEVHIESDSRRHVRFFDGTEGMVEMKELIFGDNPGVFASPAATDIFAQVGRGFGGVMWANGLDLAPDAM